MSRSTDTRLIFLEASKVRSYHATFVDGMIRAFGMAGLSTRFGRLRLLAHESFFTHLSPESRAAVDYRPVAVIDQDERKLLRKSLLEAWVVIRELAGMGRRDVLVVTAIMPSAMILVEAFKWLFPRRRLIVFQHGEIEGAFDKTRQRLGSFGFYILVWLKMRQWGSTTELAVIDDFIADELIARFPRSIRFEQVHVVPHTMVAASTRAVRPAGPPRACFIGYNTRNKGYELFERLAKRVPGVEFHATGAGADRNLAGGSSVPIGSISEFHDALGRCDIAVLPYTAAYDFSLSAAAVDAISAGMHLLTSDRGCFLALRRHFGPETVTVCADEEEMETHLCDRAWLERVIAGRRTRLDLIPRSHYSLANVGRSLARLMGALEPGFTPAMLEKAV